MKMPIKTKDGTVLGPEYFENDLTPVKPVKLSAASKKFDDDLMARAKAVQAKLRKG